MQTLKDTGKYINKEDNSEVSFSFGFDVIDSVAEVTEADLKDLNRMKKTDARNKASAKAQAQHGHNQRTLTEEQKLEKKAERASQKALADYIKAQGLNLEDLKEKLA